MEKTPDDLAAVGRVIDEQYQLTQFEKIDENGIVHKLGYRSHAQLAHAIYKDPSYIWRIRYGEKIRVNAAVWWDLAVALANGQVQAGRCPAGGAIGRAKFIWSQMMVALVESPAMVAQAEELIDDLNMRLAEREAADARDALARQERREDSQLKRPNDEDDEAAK